VSRTALLKSVKDYTRTIRGEGLMVCSAAMLILLFIDVPLLKEVFLDYSNSGMPFLPTLIGMR
jgi:hypothetical protein